MNKLAQVAPVSARGGRGRKSFAAVTAEATGMSKASINRHVRRGQLICQEARDVIRRTKLDTGRYLDDLIKCDLTPEGQVAKVKADLVESDDRIRTRVIKHDDAPGVVVRKLVDLYDDDAIRRIRDLLAERLDEGRL